MNQILFDHGKYVIVFTFKGYLNLTHGRRQVNYIWIIEFHFRVNMSKNRTCTATVLSKCKYICMLSIK